MFCNCVDVCQIYHGNNYDKMCEVLSTLKKRKMKINNILIENFKVTKKNPGFEQYYHCRTSVGINKIGFESLRLKDWLFHYDTCFYENITFML